MLGFGHVDTAEVAFGEHDALGPDGFVVGHAVQPCNGVRLFNAYSVTAISASLVEWRSRASTVVTGMSSRSANALRTVSSGCLGAPSNSLIAIRNGRLRASKKSTAAK